MANNGPSANLSWAELACHDGTQYPLAWRGDRAIELAAAFERIRALCGFPLIVNSAYRTAVFNDRIKGATRSMHIEGRALDLCPPAGPGFRLRLQALRGAAGTARGEGMLRGIGIYDGFVHIDTRPASMPRATWRGSRTPIEIAAEAA